MEPRETANPTLLRIGDFLQDHRWPVLLIILVVSLYLGTGLRQWSVSQNFKDDLPENDPDIIAFDAFNDQFGGAELLVVTVTAPDIFTRENLALVREITRRMADVRGIEEVFSLTNISDIVGTEEGLEVNPFLEEIPESVESLAALRALALSEPSWVGNLISADGRVAAINGSMDWLEENPLVKLQAAGAVERLLAELERPGVELRITGVSPILLETNKAIQYDLRTFLWLTPVLVVVLLWMIFRSARGVLIPLSIIILGVVWILGLYFRTGRSVTMITAMLPTLIGVIGLSDIIHMLSRYYEEAARGHPKRKAISLMTAHMIGPCFMTSTTTAIGFGSLFLSDIKQVKDFGLFSFVALMFVYLLGMTLVPIFLSFLRVPGRSAGRRYDKGPITRLLTAIERFVERDRFVTLTLCLVLGAVSVYGISILKVETQISRFIPQEAPAIRALCHLQENLAGVSQVEITLRGAEGVFKEPWALREIERFQRHVEGLSGVSKSFSVLDLIKEFNRAMNDGDDAFYRIPETRQLVAGYLFLFSMTGRPDLLDAFINYDESYTRISARVEAIGSAEQLRILREIDRWAQANLDPRLQMETTGVVKLYATITDALVRGQVRSLLIATLVIAVLMIAFLRSWKIGLVSMLPNLLPILTTMGFLGLFGFTLNVATVMIACIALGIAVDDTIHYLARYRKELDAADDGEIQPAMRRTLRHTGRAILFTSIVIAGGFSIFVFSQFVPNQTFGVAVAATMATAILADLLMLPLLVRKLKLGK